MTPATFHLALYVTKLPHTYTLDRSANGIGDCGVTSFKLTEWEGRLDSEMSIAVAQRKAMCVHINREQLPYLCFVMRLCSVSSLYSAIPKFPDLNNVVELLVILPYWVRPFEARFWEMAPLGSKVFI